jgi:hypothetical protein
MTALDVRNSRIAKDSAEELIAECEGHRPPSLDLFLEYVGLTEAEFNQIVLKTVVPPFEPDFESIQPGQKTPDFDAWYREQ